MGREIRRVPLDFDWPLKTVWRGFLNPHGGPCPAEARGECFDGHSPGRQYLCAIVQLLAIAGENGLGSRGVSIWPHPYIQSLPGTPRLNGQAVGPTRDLAELTERLAGRAPSLFGHDAVDRWRIESAIIKAAGLDPETWGICSVCEGHADDPAQRAAAEAWKETPPPIGDAWQLWETTSEGSPISPPMPTPEALARWLVDNSASSFGYQTESYETWLAFITGTGCAPSMVITERGHAVSGVNAASAKSATGKSS